MRNKDLESDISTVDVHFTKILKVMLERQGVMVTNLD